VIILLSLLHLNVKNIRIGPKAPAFLTPEALKVSLGCVGGRVGGLRHA
jgi:hydroxylamine reductase